MSLSDDYIWLRVTNRDITEWQIFKLRRTLSFGHFKCMYGKKMGHRQEDMYLVFGGVEINDHDTPMSLNMEPGDIIKIY